MASPQRTTNDFFDPTDRLYERRDGRRQEIRYGKKLFIYSKTGVNYFRQPGSDLMIYK
jgi:hypothetical protein